MFTLFTNPTYAKQEPYMLRDFSEVVAAMQTLVDYYLHSNYYVSNAHILVRLINMLMAEYKDIDVFDRAIKANAQSVGIIGINTQYRVGTLLDDPFVGGMNKCMLYLDEYSNRGHAPVTVTWHPYTHVNLPLLDGAQLEQDLGEDLFASNVCTYSISLRGLMYGYRKYLLDGDEGRPIISPGHYVHSRVLPRMMPSFYHLSLWNRVWNPLANRKVVDAPNRHRVKTINLYHADIPLHNNLKAMRSVNITAYAELLNWQKRRGYGFSPVGVLPAGVNIYRPTAAFAWFSRVDLIQSLILLGGHALYIRQGDLLRELMYQYSLTTKGRFIANPEQRLRLQPMFEQMLNAATTAKEKR